MMREILFRAQTRRFGERVKNVKGDPMESNWVYGGILTCNNGNNRAIIYQYDPEFNKFSVYADTIGQYTGFTDKNGTKIFEGDILKFCDDDGEYTNYEVAWLDNGWIIRDAGFIIKADDLDEFVCRQSEVIGNIHDNLEMKLWCKKNG